MSTLSRIFTPAGFSKNTAYITWSPKEVASYILSSVHAAVTLPEFNTERTAEYVLDNVISDTHPEDAGAHQTLQDILCERTTETHITTTEYEVTEMLQNLGRYLGVNLAVRGVPSCHDLDYTTLSMEEADRICNERSCQIECVEHAVEHALSFLKLKAGAAKLMAMHERFKA